MFFRFGTGFRSSGFGGFRSSGFGGFRSSGFGGFRSSGPSFRSARRYATHKDGFWRQKEEALSFWKTWKAPLLFTGGCLAFNHFVIPEIVDRIPALRRNPDKILYGLIAVNIAGLIAWRGRGTQQFMARYGLLHRDPRFFNGWSMLGSAFSHHEFWHCGINMFVLYQFGLPVARWMGSSDFLVSYFDAVVLSSLGSLMLPALFRGLGAATSLGASGAVFSIFGTFCYLAPNAKLALYFIPVPFGAWYLFLGAAGWNAFCLIARTGGRFDYAGHLAGCAVGVVYGWLVQKKIERRRAVSRSISRGWW